MSQPATGLRLVIRGVVQGIGFRPWLWRAATEAGVGGRVRNEPGGVVVELFGEPARVAAVVARLRAAPPPLAEIRAIEESAIAAEPLARFEIAASDEGGERVVSIPPDLATCADCLRELHDPADRRYRYPFINCTHCGPRYTIVRDVPYDRARTTMAAFAMCADCRREYEDPADRRFHAQPVACPACGPRLWYRPGTDAEPIAAAAAALARGEVVAVKGLGGWHLACDAGDEAAVGRLRARKHREAKPLAVMVRSLEDAERLAEVGAAARALLEGVERPIVLLRRRAGAPLAPALAPGLDLVGLFLPYTPLHHLLLAQVGRPIVLTSGNRADEPMATDDADALARLDGIADAFLGHDRAIENRCDDSVARVLDGRPVVLRRARGFVPRPLRLVRAVAAPVLACGAHLKNACAIADGDRAWLGPHVGDLETLEACADFERSVARLERFLGVRPEVVAHDLHPHYHSTRYARARPEPAKVGVQHHHAHVVACMAEHGLEGPVLGLAWDGTGWGPDGTAWGAELLWCSAARYEWLGTLRPIGLAGGEQAIREPWRLALAVLDDAFAGDPPLDELPLLRAIEPARRAVVRRMLAAGLNTPRTRGMGRWFDAIAALGLAQPVVHYEGELAMRWEHTAAEAGGLPYDFGLEGRAPVEVDLRPMVRAVVADLLAGTARALIAARFHATMAAAAHALVARALAETGPLPVVMTGGSFQNERLTRLVRDAVAPVAPVLRHARVPPGDGGLALGQALVADAVTRGGG